MKIKLTLLVLAGLLVCAGPLWAQKAVDAGNKICPISGEEVGGMGNDVEVEYEGKIYHLCCRMCLKDFKKDPEKFIEIIEDELEEYHDEEDGAKGSQYHYHEHGH